MCWTCGKADHVKPGLPGPNVRQPKKVGLKEQGREISQIGWEETCQAPALWFLGADPWEACPSSATEFCEILLPLQIASPSY